MVVVAPYVQPSEIVFSADSLDTKLVCWTTDAVAAEYEVRFGVTPACEQSAAVEIRPVHIAGRATLVNHIATLSDLPLGTRIHYRVCVGHGDKARVIAEDSFQSRKRTDQHVKFAVAGDIADGKASSRAVAYRIWKEKPEFLVAVGDIVYGKGLVGEYLSRFWPVFTQREDVTRWTGAPLLGSVPLYAVMGNHDALGLNLRTYKDGLGAFYFFHVPTNGPGFLPNHTRPADFSAKSEVTNLPGPTPLLGAPEQIADFRRAVGASYPAVCFYSFDQGPVHVLCLDANTYVNLDNEALRQWITKDLNESRAPWKLVMLHQPGFHVSKSHYEYQRVRLLSPIFQAGGVDIVFAGHVHNYQRSKPISFVPGKLKASSEVPGTFTVDEAYDGMRVRQPKGIIHIVTGGGGASLYDKGFTDRPEKWMHDKGGGPAIGARVVSDRHSFSLVDAAPTQLRVRQLDDFGGLVDDFFIEKPGGTAKAP